MLLNLLSSLKFDTEADTSIFKTKNLSENTNLIKCKDISKCMEDLVISIKKSGSNEDSDLKLEIEGDGLFMIAKINGNVLLRCDNEISEGIYREILDNFKNYCEIKVNKNEMDLLRPLLMSHCPFYDQTNKETFAIDNNRTIIGEIDEVINLQVSEPSYLKQTNNIEENLTMEREIENENKSKNSSEYEKYKEALKRDGFHLIGMDDNDGFVAYNPRSQPNRFVYNATENKLDSSLSTNNNTEEILFNGEAMKLSGVSETSLMIYVPFIAVCAILIAGVGYIFKRKRNNKIENKNNKIENGEYEGVDTEETLV